MNDQAEAGQHPRASAAERIKQCLGGAGENQVRANPEDPAAAGDQVQQSAQQNQGEFYCEHGVSLPRRAAEGGLFDGFLDRGARVEHGVVQTVEYRAARVFVIVAAVFKDSVDSAAVVAGDLLTFARHMGECR